MKISQLIIIAGSILLATTAYRQFTSSDALRSNGLVIPKHVVPIFEGWRSKHAKAYSTSEERSYRLGIFYKNYLKVKNHDKTRRYTIGLNKFADMSKEEFRVKHMGYKRT